jgi:hypothetical protein
MGNGKGVMMWWLLQIEIGGDIVLLFFLLFIFQLLIILFFAVLLLRLFLSTLMHIEILLLIVVIRNGSFAAPGLEGKYFSAHLKGQSTVLRGNEQVFAYKDQCSEFGLVILQQESPVLEIVDEVRVVARH